MAIPDYQSLMLPVLAIAAIGEIGMKEAVSRIAEQARLTPDELSTLLPSGKQTVFGNRTHWAKTYLAKAGLVESTRRGYFKITPIGQRVLEKRPARIDNSFLEQFEGFQHFKARARASQVNRSPGAQAPEAAFIQIETPTRS